MDKKTFEREEVRGKLQEELQLLLEEEAMAMDEEQTNTLLDFLTLMLEQNLTMNLSAIVEPRDVIRLHVLDSLSILPQVDEEQKRLGVSRGLGLLDLGTGAGFPGVPIKIVRPKTNLLLVDALAKRLNYLDRSLTTLQVKQPWATLHARAEDIGRDKKHREQYDFVCARAVARLQTLLEYALPLVRVGGVFCAMKAKAKEEIEEAERATRLLGAEIECVEQFILAGTGQERSIILFRKTKPCAKQYPRSHAQIKKKPL